MSVNVSRFEDLEPLIKSDIWKQDDEIRKWIWEQIFKLMDMGVKKPPGFHYDDPIGSDYFNEYFTDDEENGSGQEGGRMDTELPQPVNVSNSGEKETEEQVNTGSKDGDTNAAVQQPEMKDDEDDENFAPPVQNMEDFFEFSPERDTTLKKFGHQAKQFDVIFKNLDKVADYEKFLFAVITSILEKAHAWAQGNDRIGVTISHPALNPPIETGYPKRGELTTTRIMNTIDSVAQSGKEIRIGDEGLQVTITRVGPPKGARLSDPHKTVWRKWYENKCGGGSRATFIPIENKDDNLCFARAVATAKARIDHMNDPDNGELKRYWKSISQGDKNRYTLQKRMAIQLMRQAGLENHQRACGVEEWPKIQEVLGDGYQIKIFYLDNRNQIFYEGKVANPETASKLYLYLHHGHFSVIASIKSFFNCSYFCDRCNKGYNTLEEHKCVKKCIKCKKTNTNCPPKKYTVYCDDCYNWFADQQCYDNHKSLEAPAGGRGEVEKKKRKLNMSTCQQYRRCKDCGKQLDTMKQKTHLCGYVYCPRCKQHTRDGDIHHCYLQKPTTPKKKKSADELQADREEMEGDDPDGIDAMVRREERRQELADGPADEDGLEEILAVEIEHWIRIYFDFETRQERKIGENRYGPVYAHEVNLCVAVKVCYLCSERWLNREPGECPNCGKNEYIFEGNDVLTRFGEWLFGGENKGAILVAHNMKGFDGQFLLQYLLKQGVAPQIIPRGRKIMRMVVKEAQVKILDSINFALMALSEMPKAFGVTEAKKGYFPHLFNTEENQDYEGPLPDASFYNPSGMKPKKRNTFYAWHMEERQRMEATGEKFNFKRELLAYCRSDVDVLARCCLKYEEEVYKVEGVRPFSVGSTAPAACGYIYRLKYMPENTIAVIPHKGYRRTDRQSNQAVRWLEWIKETEGVQIQHARNGGEKVIQTSYGKKYKVDGYAEIEEGGRVVKKRVYEYHGCCFHGCLNCYSQRRDILVPNSGKTMEDAYVATKQRTEQLKVDGYEVVEVWECEARKQLAENKEMKKFFDNYKIVEPMDPRDAFYGGRTNATKLFHVCQPNEKIMSADIVSLYPWANKWGKYPVGHPRIILENFEPITKDNKPYFGLITCLILPPDRLYHPVLPSKVNGKLMFGLCQKCMKDQLNKNCPHTDEERTLFGTWCTNAVDKAVDMGYKVLKIYELWQYDNYAHYDGKDPNTGLFTHYINANLKKKVEASGWPADVRTEEEKAAFIRGYKEREGIDIDPNNMIKNPGRKTIAKNHLNSFWGRFGMRPNMPKAMVFNDAKKFFETLADPTNELVNLITVPDNEEIIYAVFKKHDDHIEVMPNTNVVIAAFTTAIARLKLYAYLENLGDRITYFDTDSIFFLVRTDRPYEYHPEIGLYLGQISDEFKDHGNGAYADRFVSAGPKNYAYRIRKPDGKTLDIVKCRGFTLDYQTSAHINRQTLEYKVKKFVQEGKIEKTTIPRPVIRVMEDRQVVTLIQAKDHRVVYSKRRALDDYGTLPFGWR